MQTPYRTNSEIFAVQLRSFLILYFLQGLPYGIQTRYLPAHLRSVGMSLTNLGYFRMLLAPWVLKGLWAPIIDRSGDLRSWLKASHLFLVGLSVLASQYPPEYLRTLGVILFCIHLSVAVQDITLDGLLIDLLTPSQLVAGNMVQVAGYKLGAILSGGFFGFMADIAGWETLFYMLGIMYALGFIVAALFIPDQIIATDLHERSSPTSITNLPAPNIASDLHEWPSETLVTNSPAQNVATDLYEWPSHRPITNTPTPNVVTDLHERPSQTSITNSPTPNVANDLHELPPHRSTTNTPTPNVDTDLHELPSHRSITNTPIQTIPTDLRVTPAHTSGARMSSQTIPTVLRERQSQGLTTRSTIVTDLHERPSQTSMTRAMSIAGFDDTNSAPLEIGKEHQRSDQQFSIFHLFDIDGTTWLLPFVFVYKFGDQGVSTMFPMFMIDAGIDVAEVVFWSGCVGQVCSLAGSIIGGLLKKTMVESIQVLLVVQALCLMILWTAVVFWHVAEDAMHIGSLFVLMVAQMASGGVTTCTFTLIMQLSQRVPRRFRTSHYTLLATSEVAGRLLAGAITGILTDRTSYVFTFGLFSITSVLILPYAVIVPDALLIPTF